MKSTRSQCHELSISVTCRIRDIKSNVNIKLIIIREIGEVNRKIRFFSKKLLIEMVEKEEGKDIKNAYNL